jgi:DnaJ-class molecular chaperone
MKTKTTTKDFLGQCDLCRGTGKVGIEKCTKCQGNKLVLFNREVTVVRED